MWLYFAPMKTAEYQASVAALTTRLHHPALRGAVTDTALLFLASMLGNLGNYLYQFFMSQRLSPGDYGLLNALLGSFMILAIPASAVGLITMRRAAALAATQQYDAIYANFLGCFRRITPYLAVGFLAYLLLSPALLSYVRGATLLPLWLVGVSAVLSLYAPAATGTLQGLQWFKALSVSAVLGSGAKVGLGVLLVVLGFGLDGALGAVVLAIMMGIGYAFWAVRRGLSARSPWVEPVTRGLKAQAEQVWVAVAAYAGLTVFLSADIIFARHYLDPGQSGYYAVISLLGKIAFYLPGVIVTILLPKAVAARATGHNAAPYLWLGLGAIVLSSLALLVPYTLAPTFFITTLFGAKYLALGDEGLLVAYTVAMSVLALVNYTASYHLALRNRRFVFGLALGCPAVGAMQVWHALPIQLVLSLGLGGLVALAGMTPPALALVGALKELSVGVWQDLRDHARL